MRAAVFALCAFAACRPPESRARATAVTHDAGAVRAPLAAPDSLRFSPRPNRAREIEWHAFTPAAFAEAQRLGRPVLLSVAAIWCHWCHVLDETTLSDPRVIDRLNRTTIPVRIDADQNPDIERRYLLGGWPTVALLDPRGRILDGGSYMPAMQLLAILDRVVPVFTADPAHAFETLGGIEGGVHDERAPGALAADDADAVATSLLEQLDPVQGGYAGRQKFPMGELVVFLLERLEHGDERVRAPVRLWLDGMARGLYDPIEGGFYRYALHADWSSPHFEKMARTNAELIEAFARASVLFARPDDAERARGAWRWANHTLRRGELFGASQDADEAYYATDATGRARMHAPYIDPTAIAGWNAELAAAGIRAGRVLHDEAMTTEAEAIGRVVIARFVGPDGSIAHVVRGNERAMIGDLSDVGPIVELAALLAERDGSDGVAAAQRIAQWGRAHLAAPDGGWFDRVDDPGAAGLVRERYRDAELNARLAEGLAALASVAHDMALAREVESIAAVFGRGARRPDPSASRFARARARIASVITH